MLTFNGEEYTSAIMACRAIDPSQYDPLRKELWEAALASGLPQPPDYPGRIVMKCDACGIDVQVGPRQQEAMSQHAVQIYCLVCAVIYTAPVIDQTTLHNLGNPHKE